MSWLVVCRRRGDGELDPGSAAARPVLSLTKGRDDDPSRTTDGSSWPSAALGSHHHCRRLVGDDVRPHVFDLTQLRHGAAGEFLQGGALVAVLERLLAVALGDVDDLAVAVAAQYQALLLRAGLV